MEVTWPKFWNNTNFFNSIIFSYILSYIEIYQEKIFSKNLKIL